MVFLILGTLLWALCTFTQAEAVTEFKRTVVFIRAHTAPGQNVFIRGGTSDGSVSCSGPVTSDPCAVPIRHVIRPVDGSSAYSSWSDGDWFLDWQGAEPGQGEHRGQEAGGTPLMWTTDRNTHGARVDVDGFGYSDLNRFGEHFWMVDLEMDCSKTMDGWFDFKGYVTPTPGWERDIQQYTQCAGTSLSLPAGTSRNHRGRCGQMNLYYWAESECNMYRIPVAPQLPPPGSCGHRQVWGDTEGSGPGVTIVGGSPQPLGYWPWQGVLQYGSTIGGCGAVLIDRKWAVTAAHCVRGTNPAILRVRFGEQNLRVTQGTEQAIPVSNIITHYLYGSGEGVAGDYDISLLELSTSVDLSSYTVNPACMPEGAGLDAFVHDTCVASGFGSTRGVGESYRLQGATVPVWKHRDCVEHWGTSHISVRQVCMGTNTISACGGDSGGPLVCHHGGRWVLVGVTSWGTEFCRDGPSVYTRMSAFLPWIRDVTGLTF